MESNEQEKSNLLKDNPVAKVASGGSWMSKHISSPLAMGKAHSMAPRMDGPLEGNAFGKAMADNDGDYEKAKASMAPQMNNGALYQLESETKSEKEETKEKPKPKPKKKIKIKVPKLELPKSVFDKLSKKQLKRMRS